AMFGHWIKAFVFHESHSWSDDLFKRPARSTCDLHSDSNCRKILLSPAFNRPSWAAGASARLSIQEKCLQEKQSELSEHLETGVSFGIELQFDAMPFAKIREKICLPKIFMAL
ncbi:MAG: hypothetical protein WCB62_18870, partial [Pseudolabrys sp.]